MSSSSVRWREHTFGGSTAHASSLNVWRTPVNEADFTHDGRRVAVTLSVPAADTEGAADSADTLFAAADVALYEAKARGRDAVVVVAC